MKPVNKYMILLCLFLAMAPGACKKVPFYASDGATLVISSDRAYLQIGGDRAVITLLGFDEDGQPMHDHTLVLLGATLGRLSVTEVEMMSGRAWVEFYSEEQSGVAQVTARSGLVTAEPDPLEIVIGSAALDHLTMSADPSNFGPGGGRSRIRVYAFDIAGNLLAGIPVSLSATAGNFEKAEGIYITNKAGLAEDYLETAESATVTALSGEVSVEVEITVQEEPENLPPTASFTYSPTAPARGETVYFNGGLSSDSDGTIVSWEWDFGDGKGAQGEKVKHRYDWAGTASKTFAVVLKVTDDQGATATTEKTVTVTPTAKN